MNRNQKIAIGCGAAGCLGLIVIAVAAGIFYLVMQSSSSNTNRRSIISANRNSSSASEDPGADSSSSTADETVTTSMSEDDKHKLFQAAAITQDTALMQRVWKKLGLTRADGTPNEVYAQFVKDHVSWLFRNTDFVQSVSTPEQAREYVLAHIND